MKKKYFVFLLFTLSLSAQIKGVVKDSITGKPISFVNIWVENESIGTTSEENGAFELNTSKEKKLLFSIIGYYQKKSILNSNGEVFLSHRNIELENVQIIKLKETKITKIGNSVFKRVKHLQGKFPQILAKKFNYDTIYKVTPYLKQIEVFTQSDIKEAKFKLRIYNYDLDIELPSEDLVEEDIITSVKKGRNKTIIDVSKYKIKFPKNGLVVGLESMIIESNKYIYSYRYKGIDNNPTMYAPAIICNKVDEENSFMFLNLKWFKRKPNYDEVEEKDSTLEPAINLILTN